METDFSNAVEDTEPQIDSKSSKMPACLSPAIHCHNEILYTMAQLTVAQWNQKYLLLCIVSQAGQILGTLHFQTKQSFTYGTDFRHSQSI